MSSTPRPSPRPSARPLVIALLVLVLLGGIWLGGHPAAPARVPAQHVRREPADARGRRSDRAHRAATTTARSPPASSPTPRSAALVASLGDRFSHYLTPSEFREFNAPPHFTGIGVAVAPEAVVGRGLVIARVFDSSPAARAGLKAGEVIVAVNGRTLRGLSQEAATALIKGLPGTDVTLAIEAAEHPHGAHGATRHVQDHARDDLRAGGGVADQDGRRQEARRGRAARRSAPARTAKSARRSNTSCTAARAGSCSTCATTAAGWSRRRS